ncbi:DUF2207 domain-containing protein [Raoultibacter phocaeensis]|uniref:DUF2207 domain-containing protein n=1 Tax=Raoultibacter phocaeensis TaxID=2479841 RepID=UPI00111A51FE|nr:DUF2207 domain-containing protein [Raoultibacter phocaeensis]
MQTTGNAANPPISTRFRIQRPIALLALVCMLACVCTIVYALAAAPSAWAKSYDMPKTTIDAVLDDNGTLNVTETRSFKFNGDFTCVWWEFDSFGSNADMTVQSVTLEQSGTTRTLAKTDFVTSWRYEGGPGGYAYAVDEVYDSVYVFFQAAHETVSVTLNYRVEGMVTKYSDVGELYWKFVGSEWAEPSRDVQMTLHLPQPSGANPVAGEDIRAWGHGPLDGDVAFGDEGTVTFTVPRIDSGAYAEARVLFPASWLAADANVDSWNFPALNSIVKEETKQADEANRQRAATNALYIGFFSTCAVFLVICLILFFRFGREHKTTFSEQYWRDAPDRQVHPLVVKYVESWGSITTNDFATELMHLTATGAVYLGTGAYTKPATSIPETFKSIGAMLFGEQAMQQRMSQGGLVTVEDYYLARLPKANEVTSPIDRAALDLLFNQIGGGADSLWFDSIDLYAERNKESAVSGFKRWVEVVKTEAAAGHFIEKPGKALGRVLKALSWIIGLAGLFLGSMNPVFYIGTAVAIGANILVIRFMPRRSKAGAELHAKAEALENWLKDFTLLNERLPMDVKVWGEFMVYATLFGIADKVMSELRVTLPDVYREATGSASTASGSNWGLWVSDTHSVGGSVSSLDAGSAFDAFRSTVSSSFTTSSSSGSGGGGGFSSGAEAAVAGRRWRRGGAR